MVSITGQEFLSIRDLASAQHLDTQGIYAWYYFPSFPKKDIENVTDLLKSSDEETKEKGADIAMNLINKHFFKAYLYQRNWVADSTSDRYLRIPNSGVTPKFQIIMSEVPNDKYLRDKLKKDPDLIEFWSRMIREEAMGNFLSPIYVGKTEKQTFRKRLLDHVDEMRKYKEDIRKLDALSRQNLFAKLESETVSSGKSTFALRVIKNELNEDFLRVVVLPMDVGDETSRIGDLEHFINRIVRPSHGSR